MWPIANLTCLLRNHNVISAVSTGNGASQAAVRRRRQQTQQDLKIDSDTKEDEGGKQM
jgi:hypothetical protein